MKSYRENHDLQIRTDLEEMAEVLFPFFCFRDGRVYAENRLTDAIDRLQDVVY